MIRLTEDDVGGPITGRPDTEAEARSRALAAMLEPLSQPPELGTLSRPDQGEVVGDASRAAGAPYQGDLGLRAEDTTPPRDGGAADIPQPATPRTVRLTEEDVGGPIVAPVAPQPARAPTMAGPVASVAQPAQTEAKDARRPISAMQAEIDASNDAYNRRILGNALANMVRVIGMAASGTAIPPDAMPDPGAGAEAEARIRARHAALTAEKERGAREEALASARMEREAQLQDRDYALAERRLAMQEAQASQPETQSELESARAEQIRSALASERARHDPFSPESRAAQSQFAALLDTLPPTLRSRMGELFTPERLRGMSAAELDAPTRRLSAFRERGTVGGGGGGGGSWSDDAAVGALRAAAVEAGVPEAAAAMMDRRQLTAEVAQRTRRTGIGSGEEILPGVFASVALSPGEGRALRDGFSTARTSMANLREVESIANRYGVTGVVSPEASAEMRPRLVTLRAMVAQMGNTGVINPSEVPTINAALPNPTDLSQMTVGDFRAQLGAWRSLLESSIESGLIARGVDEDGVRRAMGTLRGQRPTPRAAAPRGAAPAAQAESVRVRHPDGRTGTIPRASLERARSLGFEVVE